MSVHPHPFVGAESGPYKYAIQELAFQHLSSESITTIEDKIEGTKLYTAIIVGYNFTSIVSAIASMGHLSWTGQLLPHCFPHYLSKTQPTGGVEVAEFTGEKYLHLFVLMLKDCDTIEEMKLVCTSDTVAVPLSIVVHY